MQWDAGGWCLKLKKDIPTVCFWDSSETHPLQQPFRFRWDLRLDRPFKFHHRLLRGKPNSQTRAGEVWLGTGLGTNFLSQNWDQHLNQTERWCHTYNLIRLFYTYINIRHIAVSISTSMRWWDLYLRLGSLPTVDGRPKPTFGRIEAPTVLPLLVSITPSWQSVLRIGTSNINAIY